MKCCAIGPQSKERLQRRAKVVRRSKRRTSWSQAKTTRKRRKRRRSYSAA